MTILALSYTQQMKVNIASTLLMVSLHLTSFVLYLLQFLGIVLTWKIDFLRRNTIVLVFTILYSNEICKVGNIEASACPVINLVARIIICGDKTTGMDLHHRILGKKRVQDVKRYAFTPGR